jgi:hypothetical protein
LFCQQIQLDFAGINLFESNALEEK